MFRPARPGAAIAPIVPKQRSDEQSPCADLTEIDVRRDAWGIGTGCCSRSVFSA